jgi:hypothetical protein
MLLSADGFRLVSKALVLLPFAIALMMASGCDSKPAIEDTRPMFSTSIQEFIDGPDSTPIEIELMKKLIAEGRTEFEEAEYPALCEEAKRIKFEREQKKAKAEQTDW